MIPCKVCVFAWWKSLHANLTRNKSKKNCIRISCTHILVCILCFFLFLFISRSVYLPLASAFVSLRWIVAHLNVCSKCSFIDTHSYTRTQFHISINAHAQTNRYDRVMFSAAVGVLIAEWYCELMYVCMDSTLRWIVCAPMQSQTK